MDGCASLTVDRRRGITLEGPVSRVSELRCFHSLRSAIMKHSYLNKFALLLLSGLLVFAGCSSDDDDDNNNRNSNQADVGDVGDTGGGSDTGDVGTTEDADTTADTGTTEDAETTEDTETSDDVIEEPIEPTPIPSELGPVDSCDEITEIDSVDCFSNADCESLDQRCENVGGDEFYVACCVPGVRGIRPAGESCDEDDGDLRCASGLCIDRNEGGKFCSQFCETADDCPASAPNCEAIPFLGSVCVTD